MDIKSGRIPLPRSPMSENRTENGNGRQGTLHYIRTNYYGAEHPQQLLRPTRTETPSARGENVLPAGEKTPKVVKTL